VAIESVARDDPRRLPPGQALTEKWPVLTYGDTPRVDLRRWRFRCFRLMEEEVSWTWDEFTRLPQVEVKSDVHCVTRWSRYDNVWKGVAAQEVLAAEC
jgi:DMSO/TMAO reductase YedYZ molybdopterin-dependent catalytic subunit